MAERQPINDPAVAEFAGEVRAQLKELIHNRNAAAQRDEAIARSLGKLEDMPKQLEKLEKSGTAWLQKLDERLDALEQDKVRRDQTVSLGTLLLKSPMLAWLIAGLGFLVALVKGWIKLDG